MLGEKSERNRFDRRIFIALRIAIIYLLISYVYLYFSDRVVTSLVAADWMFAVNLSKAFIFVGITAIGLFYFIHHALTETQAAETQFQRIFEESPDGIILVLNNGKILAANPAMARMLGRSPDELVGKDRSIVMDDTPEVRAGLEESRRNGEARGRFMFRRADGEAFPVDVAVKLFYLPNGERRACIIARDMREIENLEHKYREGERLRLVGHLAGGVAHDFNNLLTVIGGNAEILVDLATPETPPHRAASTILKAANQAAQLVRRLLAFARRQALDPASFDVCSRLEALLPLLREAVGSNAMVRLDCTPDIPPVFADEVQFENAILNLVINARDATTASDREIHIGIESFVVPGSGNGANTLVPGNYVAIRVTDKGVGMTPEILARAVEPFFTTKQPGQGNGLGLSTIFGFAQQSGGYMDVESKSGKGTRVTLFLPCSTDEATSLGGEGVARSEMGGQERIMIIEDDPLVRGFLQTSLSQLGYAMIAVPDATEALAILDTGRSVDLVVANMAQPRMGGEELAARLRKMNPPVRMIFISSQSNESTGRHAPAASRATAKPVQMQDLAQRIRDALDRTA